MKVGFPLAAALVGMFCFEMTTTAVDTITEFLPGWRVMSIAMAGTIGWASATDTNATSTRRKQPPFQPRKSEVMEAIPSPFEDECVWIGKRIISLLRREDIDTAQTFDRFYTAFNCPVTHLGKAFGCVVASESDREAVDEQINRCWADPYVRPSPLPPSIIESPVQSGSGR